MIARKYKFHAWAMLLIAFFAPRTAFAGKVNVAVVYSFVRPAREIAAAFHKQTGDDVLLMNGGASAFMAKIDDGAPYDVMLSSDEARPKHAVERGLALAESRFTYAMGPLVLWSRTLDVSDGAAFLRRGDFDRLAVVDPTLAPYGVSSAATLDALGLAAALKPKLLIANSLSQVFGFVEGGGADVGLVAAAQLRDVTGGFSWIVPEKLHPLIRQDAVLLEHGRKNPAAIAFIRFLRGPKARAIIESYGYGTP